MSTGTLARNLLRTQSLPLVGTRITNMHMSSHPPPHPPPPLQEIYVTYTIFALSGHKNHQCAYVFPPTHPPPPARNLCYVHSLCPYWAQESPMCMICLNANFPRQWNWLSVERKKMSAEGKEINGTKRKRAEGARFRSFSCESIPMPGFVLCQKGI